MREIDTRTSAMVTVARDLVAPAPVLTRAEALRAFIYQRAALRGLTKKESHGNMFLGQTNTIEGRFSFNRTKYPRGQTAPLVSDPKSVLRLFV